MPRHKASSTGPLGTLFVIGGHEDKSNDKVILTEIAKRVGSGKLVIATVASTVGDELWVDYRTVFRGLGVKNISHLDVNTRRQAVDVRGLKTVQGAKAVFFTGGDQLRITSELGGTPIADEITRIYEAGGIIAGTSAGASVMSETMLVSGPATSSVTVKDSIRMAPGLGFVKDMIIDQHFAERGRISRLIGAVAQNPKFLGVGIDEDTAIIMDRSGVFSVIGSGAVYVIDAREATGSNISEATADSRLSIYNSKIHVLSSGHQFSMRERSPLLDTVSLSA